MESELLLNKSINVSTAQNIKSLIQWGFDRLPDNREAASINREAKQIVDTYLDLAIKNPTNTNHIGNAVSRVNNFLEKHQFHELPEILQQDHLNETLHSLFHFVLLISLILLEQLHLTIIIFGGCVKMVDIGVNSVDDPVCSIPFVKNESILYFLMSSLEVATAKEKLMFYPFQYQNKSQWNRNLVRLFC